MASRRRDQHSRFDYWAAVRSGRIRREDLEALGPEWIDPHPRRDAIIECLLDMGRGIADYDGEDLACAFTACLSDPIRFLEVFGPGFLAEGEADLREMERVLTQNAEREFDLDDYADEDDASTETHLARCAQYWLEIRDGDPERPPVSGGGPQRWCSFEEALDLYSANVSSRTARRAAGQISAADFAEFARSFPYRKNEHTPVRYIDAAEAWELAVDEDDAWLCSWAVLDRWTTLDDLKAYGFDGLHELEDMQPVLRWIHRIRSEVPQLDQEGLRDVVRRLGDRISHVPRFGVRGLLPDLLVESGEDDAEALDDPDREKVLEAASHLSGERQVEALAYWSEIRSCARIAGVDVPFSIEDAVRLFEAGAAAGDSVKLGAQGLSTEKVLAVLIDGVPLGFLDGLI